MIIINYLVASIVGAIILFALGNYIYTNFKKNRLIVALRNVLILFVVIGVMYYGTNHNWFGNQEPCSSFDMRGCTE